MLHNSSFPKRALLAHGLAFFLHLLRHWMLYFYFNCRKMQKLYERALAQRALYCMSRETDT